MRVIWWHSLPPGDFSLYRLSGRDRACAPASFRTRLHQSWLWLHPRLGVPQASANKLLWLLSNGEVIGRRCCLRAVRKLRSDGKRRAAPHRAAPQTHPTVAVVEWPEKKAHSDGEKGMDAYATLWDISTFVLLHITLPRWVCAARDPHPPLKLLFGCVSLSCRRVSNRISAHWSFFSPRRAEIYCASLKKKKQKAGRINLHLMVTSLHLAVASCCTVCWGNIERGEGCGWGYLGGL